MSNEWEQPSAPPPPLFTGKSERDFVKQVNDELIESVIGQSIVYYPIDSVATNYHGLYGEAIEKTFLPPVRVYALIVWDGIETTNKDSLGLDKTSAITIKFHKRRLTEDQDLYVREGDFVSYGDIYYEIMGLSEPRQLFGQTDFRFEIVANCSRAREGLFDGR